MKTQIIKTASGKTIVKVSAETSEKQIKRLEKQLHLTLNYCDSDGETLVLWDGPSNVRYAGVGKSPSKLARHLQSRCAKMLKRLGYGQRKVPQYALSRAFHAECMSPSEGPKLP